MYPNNDRITTTQMINILILTMIGVGVLTLPADISEIMEGYAWLPLLTGGIVAMGIAFFHGYIIKLFPGKGLFEVFSITVTKPIAYLLSIFMILYFIGSVGLLARIFIEVIKVLLLPRTPLEIIVISMLLGVVYLVRVGIEPMARLTNILFPTTVILVMILFALTFGKADFSNLRPFFEITPMQLLKASNVVLYSLLGFELLLVFGVHLQESQKAVKIGPIAVGMVLLFYLLLDTSALSNLGSAQLRRLIWPTISVFRSIEFPGAFIENVEVVVMAIWIFSTFMTLAPFYLGITILLKDTTVTKEHNYFALPTLPFVYFITMYSDSIADVYEDLGVFTDYTAYFVILGIPLVVFIGRALKKIFERKGKENMQ